MERKPATVLRSREHRFRHDCKSAAHAGESAVLGKTAQFNRALAGARNFENGMRNIRVRNIGFVRGIEEKQRFVLARVIDPARELFTRRNGPRRIIGKTEINKIGVFCRWVGDKSVLSWRRPIKNSLLRPYFFGQAASA